MLIDKTKPSCPTKRKDYWIGILKTKASIGLNFDLELCFLNRFFGSFTFLQLHLDGFVLGIRVLDWQRIYVF